MKRLTALTLTAVLALAACGGDDTTAAADDSLTDAERAWCSFDSTSEEDAFRFDQIFESGLFLGLPMDALNAQASALLEQYMEEGMTEDDAVRAVSDDLLEEEVFIAACKEAYATNVG